jgi:hypothetical protein
VTRAHLHDDLRSVAAADLFDASRLDHLAYLLVVRHGFELDMGVFGVRALDLDLPGRELEVEPNVARCVERLAPHR